MTNRLTFAERTDSNRHRSPIILRTADDLHYLAEFESTEQLDQFCGTLGVAYRSERWYENEFCGIIREFRTSHRIQNGPTGGFWSRYDLPEGARPIKALSNGSIVTCYFVNDGETVTIYRPNPNAHAVYHPLPLDLHIAHRRIYGSY